MKILLKCLLTLIMISKLLVPEGLAQNLASGHISGTIQDSLTQQPLDYVTINLKTSENILIKATVTRKDGSFELSGLTPGKFVLSVFFIGYATKTIPVEIVIAPPKLNLGLIHLSQKSGNLAEIVITGQKPIIKQLADRITYDLQADPDSKGSSVLEMMRKIPFLSVDADENLFMKGNTNYRVFVNGRPSGMMDRNLKEVLKSMPAATIQSIEIITNPPSKYDGEGLSGIINIVTAKMNDNGYNASLNVSERFPVGGPGAGTSVTFREGKLGISALSGGALASNPTQDNTTERMTTGTAATHLNQSGRRESDNKNAYGSVELNYQLNTLNLISAQFNISGSESSGSSDLVSQLKNPGTVLEVFGLDNSYKRTGSGLDGSLNYQLGFAADKNKLLTISYRYMDNANEQNNAMRITDRINYDAPDSRQFNQDRFTEQTAQIDYVHPFKKLNIEGGAKAIFRTNASDYQYLPFNSGSGTFIPDPARSNTFNNCQKIYALYNSYRFTIKGLNFQAGFRAEQTVVDADFLSTASRVKQNYFNFIPTISMSRSFKDNSGINLGFSQRIKRPGINRLNPFVDRSNPGFETSGNPELKPETINAVMLGYNRSSKLNITAALNFISVYGITLPVAVYDPVTNITRTTSENNGDINALGTNINLSYPLTKKININLNGEVLNFWIKGIDKGVRVYNDLLSYYATLSSAYRFDSGWRISAAMTAISRNPTGFQGTTNSMLSSSVGFNKDLIKDKLSFSATANNPLTKYRNSIVETSSIDFIQFERGRNYFRSFNGSLNYHFGKLKEGINKNKRGINNDDVANGKTM